MAATINTLNALLRRGIDSITASKLVSENYTIQDLLLKSIEELCSLGFSVQQASFLLDEGRPPIPEDTFMKVLSDSKWVCCICRDVDRGIIIHHIDDWKVSKSHAYDNLAVLCLLHHDQAHTKKGISLMLSPERLKKSRNLWYAEVQNKDNAIINNIEQDRDVVNLNDGYIDNVEDFLRSIKSNSKIKLRKGKYNLSDIEKLRKNPNVTWRPVFNGYEPHITGVVNLQIIGEDGVEILIDPSYTWVLKFINCKGIAIENITFGHTTPGSCTGGVLMFDSCDNIKIKKCDLFGCGTYGVTLTNCVDFLVEKSIIRECTYGIAQFYTAKNILFRDCQFFDCCEFDLITFKESCVDINFLRCRFENNFISTDYGSFVDIDSTCREIVIEYSQIYSNKVSKWVNIDGILVTRHNDYKENGFLDPKDVWWFDSK